MLIGQRPSKMSDAFAQMLELSAKHFANEEGQEGMRAFAEKRKPAWVSQNLK
ncbi:hypothetical protein [Saccharopolyspora phatthalungensis]|uniref:Methylglutaconyl-CoA hydratase n=1 Tax=Saccharopolyspora phatthalungensis TaxID=664693 RepID=A0A840Q2I8_9PSEU|nr:hypothetical protein [Saccharopolyspora phatthalungensis]MBB5152978.1 methylglutaconyl-CoA hydratase [Saccharopolyspora phatthalungensis]